MIILFHDSEYILCKFWLFFSKELYLELLNLTLFIARLKSKAKYDLGSFILDITKNEINQEQNQKQILR